ncbi:MAG: hypothetical protein H6739_20800 [Alphaproteobacteria bacterium]|nr:hypothetical protein [Alphaproteobacteria bacterium]
MLRATHLPTGAGFVLRHWDKAQILDVRKRVERKLDVEAAMSPDRVALLFQKSHEDEPIGETLYVGPADGVDPQVGRWVYRPPAAEGEPERVWWQVFWRSADDYHQLVAWSPAARFADFAQAMRALEGSITPAPGFTAPQTLLFDSGRDDCGPPARADRALAIRDSRRFTEARERLRAAWTPYRDDPPAGALDPASALYLAELTTMDALYRSAEACVHKSARERRDCRVLEGPVSGASSEAFQQGVVRCIDEDPELDAALDAALAKVLGAT